MAKRTRRRTLTEAEKAVKAAEHKEMTERLRQGLEDAVMGLATSEGWMAMLTQMARAAGTEIGRFSANNIFLILTQCPHATAVCTYKQWQERGRQVMLNQKSLRIFAPITAKKKGQEADDVPSEEEGGEGRPKGYMLVPRFDASQTEPMWQHKPKDGLYFITPALPAPVKRFGAGTPGEAPAEMWRMLTAYAVHHGYSVETGETGTAQGWTRPSTKTVRVSDKEKAAQASLTLAHEVAGHIGCGHVADMDGYFRHRGRMETEAESVAHMVAAFYGVDATVESADYIAGWAGREPKEVRAMLTATAETVRSTFRAFLEFRESPEAAVAMEAAQAGALPVA
ncbi:ArdC-like ssDNA-binding domain-containing protein [Kitasatospora sp. NPDC002965]|uniref:ArdC-like ssDNA-binding domain-containing protein n=1 Tax=Kitasatospora sp. NPDC002965 TaxID=3154775 RepID=UPI0033B22807